VAEWRDCTLGDAITLQRGFDITREQQRPGDIPVVSSGGVSSYHDVASVRGPGVVIGRKGTLGRVFFFEGPYWPHDTTLWVKDFKGSAPRFVYYFMKTLNTSWLDVGSANPTLNRNHLHPLKVHWPPVDAQRAIAEVLGALDDKISANTRLATTADELATAIFARAAADAAFGPSTFADVADIGGGGTPSSKVAEYWDGRVPWASPTDITRLSGPYLFETGKKITELGLANCSSRLYPSGSILMTSRATIGAFALAQTPVAVNQGFIVVVPPDDTLRYWLLHEMRDRVDEFLTHANGATFLELSRGNFRRLPVRLAEPSVMAAFSHRANALHTAGAAVLRENLALAATRDALLPVLMSGRLRVRDAERLAETLT